MLINVNKTDVFKSQYYSYGKYALNLIFWKILIFMIGKTLCYVHDKNSS
jgi:hypothetical protein